METEKIEKLEDGAELAALSELELAARYIKEGRLTSAVNVLKEIINQLD